VPALGGAGMGVGAPHHHSEAEAAQLCAQLRDGGAECWIVRADLERSEDVESLIDRARAMVGRPIDALVNNASIFPADTVANATREEMTRCLSVNAWVPLALSRALAGQVDDGGVVNLLDAKLAAYDSERVSYLVSKSALELLTRVTAIELAPHVAVNAVSPGLILPPSGRDQAWLDERAQRIPLARVGHPSQVAEAVLFLLRSRYVTGQVLYVDGGIHLGAPSYGSHTD
ncbi:MAG: SDR family oxidoreductase, partial [Myxococcaceae bacterium]